MKPGGDPDYKWREPLERFIGAFEAQIATIYGGRYLQMLDIALLKFFSRFPRKSRPEQFHITDVEDYRQERLGAGLSPHTVTRELGMLRSFFNWYIYWHAPDMPNPVKGFRRRSKLQDAQVRLRESLTQ